MQDSLKFAFRQELRSNTGRDYVNLQQLGRGGTAETYLVLAASGPHAGLLFALKIFRRLSKPEWRESFLREIAFLRDRNHPSIMRVFDEGLYLDEHPFVVAEYLPQTLASTLRARLTTVDRLSWTLQLLSALRYLASPDVLVVHRDIKPQNIFLKAGSCVLGDFGLVKRLHTDPEADRQMLKESAGPRMPRLYRTPDLVAYLAGGPPPTPKSDVFQLGLVLAELFTGRNPQRPLPQGADFTEPVELEPLGFIPGALGKPIKTHIERMLSFDWGARPSAAELMHDWRGLFLNAAERAHALDGFVI